MEKQIFKVGDRVFDVRFGWGEICNISCYYIDVKFDKKYETQTYSDYGAKLLSFTEYTLEGFSQERPIDYNDYIDKWGKFWNHEEEGFSIGKLKRYNFLNKNHFFFSGRFYYDFFEPLTEEQIKFLGLE